MDNFRETAIGLTVWYAFLAILGGLFLIVLNDLEAPTAFLAGANHRAPVRARPDRQIAPPERTQNRARGNSGARCRRRSGRAANPDAEWRAPCSKQTWLSSPRARRRSRSCCPGLAYASHGTDALGRAQRDPAHIGATPPSDSALAADELKQHLAPVRPRAVFGQIDALPGAERELPPATGTCSGRREHRLDMRRHVVGAFRVVHPAGIRGRKTIQRGHKVGLHVRIGVLLNDQRRRGVADDRRAARRRPLPPRCRKSATSSRDLDETLRRAFRSSAWPRRSCRRAVLCRSFRRAIDYP